MLKCVDCRKMFKEHGGSIRCSECRAKNKVKKVEIEIDAKCIICNKKIQILEGKTAICAGCKKKYKKEAISCGDCLFASKCKKVLSGSTYIFKGTDYLSLGDGHIIIRKCPNFIFDTREKGKVDDFKENKLLVEEMEYVKIK